MLTSKKKERLRAVLEGNLPGLDSLEPKDQHKVQQMLTRKWMQQIRKAMSTVAITRPLKVSWQCNRCGRIYKQRLSCAQKHADRNECKPKRRTRRAPPKSTSHSDSTLNAYGHRRLLTWRANIHRILRKEQTISKLPFRGCRCCIQRRKQQATRAQCERCFFLEWMGLAQDPETWDKLVYGEEKKKSAATKRRMSKWKTPEESWDDPRHSLPAHGGLIEVLHRKYGRPPKPRQMLPTPVIQRRLGIY